MHWKYLVISSILNIGISYENDQIDIDFPKNCFGVFVTIKRSEKLEQWPKDVHGCIGYWSKNNLDKTRILDKLISVSHKESFKDERSKYFKSLLFDRNAVVEVNFLLNDLKKVTTFNNNLGVILEKEGDFLATFLPGVFSKNEGWINVKDSLIKKSKVKSSDKNNFYSYPTKLVSFKLSDIYEEYDFVNFWIKNLIKNLHIKKRIPYKLKGDIISY